jgi:hypothetical protein
MVNSTCGQMAVAGLPSQRAKLKQKVNYLKVVPVLQYICIAVMSM